MGGSIISIDVSFGMVDKIYASKDCLTTEEEKKDMDKLDGRRTQRHIKTGVLTLHNYAHFAYEEVLTPDATEQHSFICPEIGLWMGGVIINSEKRINQMCVKHDGLESNKYTAIKAAETVPHIYRDYVINGYIQNKFHGQKVPMESLSDRSHVKCHCVKF